MTRAGTRTLRGLARMSGTAAFLSVYSLAAPAVHAGLTVVAATNGSDTASCGSDKAPCRSLQHAVDRAGAHGTVFLHGPGEFLPATIPFAITIIGSGVYAPGGVPCLTVNAGDDDWVNVTKFTCNQPSNFLDGIVVNSAFGLRLESVTLVGGRGSGCGIRVKPTKSSDLYGESVSISNFGVGICLEPVNTGKAGGAFKRGKLQGNSYGVRSISGTGVGSVIRYYIGDSTIMANGTGIRSGGSSSRIYVYDSQITGNTVGLQGTGEILSDGGNTLSGNGTNGKFSVDFPKE